MAGSFDVDFQATADQQTHARPVRGWVDAGGGASCGTVEGAGPYTVTCSGLRRGHARLSVHVTNANGVTTDVPLQVIVH